MSSLQCPSAAGAPIGAGHNDRMKVDWWPVEKLWQARGDPRRYTARDIKKAEGVVRRFGIRLPLVISSDGCVVAHWLAVVAARRLGIDQVPVLYADDLPAAERQMLSLALNRFYELGQFDHTLLGELVLDLEAKVPELRFEDFGFEAAEIDRAVIAARSPDDEAEEAVLKIPCVVATQRGDIWRLDKHEIGCGDATEPASYERLLGAQRARMVFTDPPYGCRVQGFVTSRDHREFPQGSGELDRDGLFAFFKRWCEAMAQHCEPGAVIELCIDWRSAPLLMQAASAMFGDMVNMAVWVKDRAGMGSFLRSQHELVLIYAVPGAQHRNNVELGKNGRNRSNVWKYPCAMSFARTGAEGDLLEDHPTPKPKDLVADAIFDCTARGDLILDPFLGSGSTLIAAEKTGRVCRGMDLDPAYVDLAVRRWQSWTGRDAIHALSGKRFDDVRAEAEAAASRGEVD